MIFTYLISIYLYPCEWLCYVRLVGYSKTGGPQYISCSCQMSSICVQQPTLSPSVPPLSAVCPLNTVDYSSEFIVLSL